MQIPELDEFFELLLSTELLLLAAGIWLLLRWLKRFPWMKAEATQRVLPLIPEVLSVTACLAGGVPHLADETWVVRIGAGLFAAYLSERFHKILGQTILGDDREISDRIRRQ